MEYFWWSGKRKNKNEAYKAYICSKLYKNNYTTYMFSELPFLTCITKFRLSQSRNILKPQLTLANILSLTMEKLSWSLEVNRSTSLNHRQEKRFVIGMCSLIMTHPSGTSAIITCMVIDPQFKRFYASKRFLKREPTTCNRKLSIRIWCKTFFSIKVNLVIYRGIVIFPCSFISFSFFKHIKTRIVSWYSKRSILTPQKPERIQAQALTHPVPNCHQLSFITKFMKSPIKCQH